MGLLQLTVAAVLCGARSLSALAQWGRERLDEDPTGLVRLGLPPGRCPCLATLHRRFKALAGEACEAALGAWLQTTGVSPHAPLARDGQTLRGTQGEQIPGVHLVAAYAHPAGVLLAHLRRAGHGQALAAAKAVVAQVPLAGRWIPADALLTQRAIGTPLVAGGGA